MNTEYKKLIAPAALVIIITFITFAPSLTYDFTNLDDTILVTENTKIRDLSLKNIGHFFTSRHSSLYHPLVLVSFAIEYRLFGLNPAAYHAGNIFLHLLNCLLVFWLIYLISNKNIIIAMLTSLLFGIHPLHVESVSWISERKDVLYSLFFLSSAITYLHYRKNSSLLLYISSLFLFICSLFSKPMAVTLPFILILFDILILPKLTGKHIINKIPFLAAAILFGILAVLINIRTGNIRQPESVTILQIITNATTALSFYLVKTIAPFKLSCLYPMPAKFDGFMLFLFRISPVLIIFIAALVILSVRRTKKVLFGSMFFLITLAPILQIIPVGKTLFSDRNSYIPLIGIFYIAAEGFWYMYTTRIKNILARRISLTIIGITALIILPFLSRQRSMVWQNSITLWNDAIKKYPLSAADLYLNRGKAYKEIKEFSNAVADFNIALTLCPSCEEIYTTRAETYSELGEHSKAINDYSRAISLNPKTLNAYNGRGNTYAELKEYPQSLSDFNIALTIDPNSARTWYNMGVLYTAMGELDRAAYHYKQAASLDPYYKDAWYNSGLVSLEKGDPRKAITDFTRAIQANPSSVESYLNRGNAYIRTGEQEKALNDFSKAINIDPSYTDAYYNRGNTYFDMGAADHALDDYNKVISLDPSFAKAYNNRGNIYLRKGKFNQAITNYNNALAIDPDYANVYYNRAVAYANTGDITRAWQDIRVLQDMQYAIDPVFLAQLKSLSGK